LIRVTCGICQQWRRRRLEGVWLDREGALIHVPGAGYRLDTAEQLRVIQLCSRYCMYQFTRYLKRERVQGYVRRPYDHTRARAVQEVMAA